MRNKKEIGNWGENLAKNFLIERQYSILASNWSHNNTEIDIICRKNNIIIFVEVKTRKSIQFGLPESFVDTKKKEQMIFGASEYCHQIGHEWEIRFDIITICYENMDTFDINHLKDVFFDEW